MRQLYYILFFMPTLLCSFELREQKAISDIGLYSTASYGYVLGANQGDFIGSVQLTTGLIFTTWFTEIIKGFVKEERPNGCGNRSFPSGHTSCSFYAAGFVSKRYGLQYGIPALAVATLVGALRVATNTHYTHDVVAGSILGLCTSYLFTTRNLTTISTNPHSKTVSIKKTF